MDKETSEIVKLTERISKDPKSKLFVPLAEEYKKVGDIEMAIHVLSEGLKNNPSYVTARSLLGRLLYDNGDLIAAQKEFEEVVKAIPDNLLAQRKLGDLYSLRNNQIEALKHYKIALALNPGDKVFAAHISKLEKNIEAKLGSQHQREPITKISGPPGKSEQSGVPDKSVVAVSVSQTSLELSEQQSSMMESSLAAPEPSSGDSDHMEKKAAESFESAEVAGREIPFSKKPEEPAFLAVVEQKSDSISFTTEMEEPEDVLVVEPLDEERPPDTQPAEEEIFPYDEIHEIASAEEEIKSDISLPGPKMQEAEPVLFSEQESAVPVNAAAQAPPLAVDTKKTEEQEPAGKQPADESDDFTTDTLAELYIAQGFYEKAIDIYQRMMEDRPDSPGLKEKLNRVRAMAEKERPEEYATAVMESIGALEEKIKSSIFEEPKEYAIPLDSSEKAEETPIVRPTDKEIEEDHVNEDKQTDLPSAFIKDKENRTRDAWLATEPDKNTIGTRTDTENNESNVLGTTKEYRSAEDITASPADRSFSSKHELFDDFKPMEYSLPAVSPQKSKEEKVHLVPRQSIAARKETIDRLENWLKTIKKER